MFGIGNRNRSAWARSGSRRNTGVFGGNRLRNAAIAGLGMLAFRWWRNRNAPRTGAPGEAPNPAGRW